MRKEMEVKHSYDGHEVTETGTTSFCSWDRLKRHLEEACDIRSHEEISSIVASKDGISIYLKTKPATP